MSLGAIGVTILVTGAVFCCSVIFYPRAGSTEAGHVTILSSYEKWWIENVRLCRLHIKWNQLPGIQVFLCFVFLPIALIWGQYWGLLILSLWAIVPALVLKKIVRHHQDQIGSQVDGMLTNLSSTLSSCPNLQDALGSILESEPIPIKEEIEEVLSDVKLGRNLDDALAAMSGRLNLPGLESFAVSAAMGRRTGGDLAGILKETANTLREISRLEGVVKTKTAEGRNQALVMGLVPPFLIGVLQWINPDWLAPMWNDPIGWALLGLTAVMEIVAIVLIRKITAVDV